MRCSANIRVLRRREFGGVECAVGALLKLLSLGTARGLQGLTEEALRRLAARFTDLWAALRTAWIDARRLGTPTLEARLLRGAFARLAA